MAAAGVPTRRLASRHDRRRPGSRRSTRYPVVLKADGLAAGKGVVIAADEDEARAALEEMLVARRFGDTPRRRRGAPRRRGAVAAGARATASARCRWRRRRTTSGSATATPARTPAAWARTRRWPAVDAERDRADQRAVHQPVVDELRAAGHAVSRRPLRRAHADRRRAARCSSSTCASATPRRRRSCRACARTCSSCSRAAGVAGAGLDGAVSSSGTPRRRSRSCSRAPATRRAAYRRRHRRARRRRAAGIEVTHAGTALRDGGALVTAGGRVLNVTALGAGADAARDAAYAAADVIDVRWAADARRHRGEGGDGGRPGAPHGSRARAGRAVADQELAARRSRGRGRARGPRRRRAARRHPHGLEVRHGRDGEGRGRAGVARHPARGPRHVGPPRARHGRRLRQERAHARASGSSSPAPGCRPRCPASSPPTPICR